MKVIHRKYIPTDVPTLGGVVLWLWLDKMGIGPTGRGIWWTLYSGYFVICVFLLFVETQVKPNDV